MAIINQFDKRSGIIYVYKSVSYWDKEKQQPRVKRKLIGKRDLVTGEIIPTDGGEKNAKDRPNVCNRQSTNRYPLPQPAAAFIEPLTCWIKSAKLLVSFRISCSVFLMPTSRFSPLHTIWSRKAIRRFPILKNRVVSTNTRLSRIFHRNGAVKFSMPFPKKGKITSLNFRKNVAMRMNTGFMIQHPYPAIPRHFARHRMVMTACLRSILPWYSGKSPYFCFIARSWSERLSICWKNSNLHNSFGSLTGRPKFLQ